MKAALIKADGGKLKLALQFSASGLYGGADSVTGLPDPVLTDRCYFGLNSPLQVSPTHFLKRLAWFPSGILVIPLTASLVK